MRRMYTNRSEVTRALLSAGAMIIAFTLCATAMADGLEIRLGGSESAISDDSFDFLSEDNFKSVGQLSIHTSVFSEHLWFGLEYESGTESFDPFPEVSNTLDSTGLSAAVRGQFDLNSFMTPYVSTLAGLSQLELTTALEGQRREEEALVGVFTFLAGVDLHMPVTSVRRFFNISRRSWARDMTFGLVFEGGYQLTTSAQFNTLAIPEPDKEPEPEDKKLSDGSIRFGDLDLSGVILRSAFVVRF